MSALENPVHRTLQSLAQAVRSWVDDGDEGKLARWVSRELDADGVPIRLPVSAWPRVLENLAAARRQRGDWPPGSAAAIDGLIQAALRFSRPDGSPVMHDGDSDGTAPIWSSPDWSAAGTRGRGSPG